MSHPQPLRGSLLRLALLLSMVCAVLACSRQEEFDRMFRERLAKRALACFHPLGDIKSAGPIEITTGDTFRGTIYWQGGFSGNDYQTRIEARIGSEVATIHLLEDTSPISAAETTCLVPLEEAAVPVHAEDDGETSETSGEVPAETSGLPDDAPPPP